MTSKKLCKIMIKTVEELAELSQAMCKSIVRLNSTEKGFTLSEDLKSVDNLFEEIADVEIMLAQCKMMFHCEKEVQGWKDKKLERLKIDWRVSKNDTAGSDCNSQPFTV